MVDPIGDSQALPRQLRQVSIFATLSDAELEILAAELDPLHLPADETLFEKGAAGDSLFVVISGRLEAFDPADQYVWGRILPGELVGEMGLLTGERRRATVRALRDSLLLGLTKVRFLQLVERHPAPRTGSRMSGEAAPPTYGL